MGNFSKLGEVADMYRHCKATEDVDMGLEDFITEHVFNLKIEDIFEKHQSEKQHQSEKPSPYQHNNTNNITIVLKVIERFSIQSTAQIFCVNIFFPNKVPVIINNFASVIFRPPITSSFI